MDLILRLAKFECLLGKTWAALRKTWAAMQTQESTSYCITTGPRKGSKTTFFGGLDANTKSMDGGRSHIQKSSLEDESSLFQRNLCWWNTMVQVNMWLLSIVYIVNWCKCRNIHSHWWSEKETNIKFLQTTTWELFFLSNFFWGPHFSAHLVIGSSHKSTWFWGDARAS